MFCANAQYTVILDRTFEGVTVSGVVCLTIQLWKQLINVVCSRLHCFLSGRENETDN